MKRWLSLKEASEYSGTGKDLLKKLLDTGTIKGGRRTDKKTKDYFFDRFSIDKYMESMMTNAVVHQKALDVMRRAGIKCVP